MEKEYSYKDNVVSFKEKKYTFNEKIAEIIEFEKCIVVRSKYSNENPSNNLVAFDFAGNKIWEIEDVISALPPQTIVSIGKKDSQCLCVITFAGLNFEIRVETGEILSKTVTK